MNVELVNTGTELILGRALNSNQQWLSRQLAELALPIVRQTTVGDAAAHIQQAIREALSRANLVLVTGGLGPTSDDRTRDAVAQLLGRKLQPRPEVLAAIRDFFARRGRPMPESTLAEALVPEGALVLPNRHGTAPGLAVELAPNPFRPEPAPAWLILLPGPPRELRPMFTTEAVPLLQRIWPAREPFACQTLRSIGLGESIVHERLGILFPELERLAVEIGYCARPGEVDVRLTARGLDAERRIAAAARVVEAQLGERIFGVDEEDLAEVVVRQLRERRQTVAFAESCTGGALASRLTDIPGASEVFRTGLVPYSNAAKQQLLGVAAETLARHGAVSEPVARAMADGARRVSEADYAIAITGIAGPGGGTADKPAGTVFIALASATGTQVEKRFNPWDRLTFKEVTVQQALDLLRLRLRHPAAG